VIRESLFEYVYEGSFLMDAITLRRRMQNAGIDLAGAALLTEKALEFPQGNRLADGCRSGIFDEHAIFRRVLDFALEASGPSCRNPAAVFTAIIKKEVGYSPTNSAHAVGEV
jgi:hypothetical protein